MTKRRRKGSLSQFRRERAEVGAFGNEGLCEARRSLQRALDPAVAGTSLMPAVTEAILECHDYCRRLGDSHRGAYGTVRSAIQFKQRLLSLTILLITVISVEKMFSEMTNERWSENLPCLYCLGSPSLWGFCGC